LGWGVGPQAAVAATPDTATPSAVEVVFVDAARYVDAGDSPAEVAENETVLRRHLQALGQRWLPQGARLRIEVTGIDLAGQVLPALRSPQRLRVLDGGADWPQIALRYLLARADGVTERGEESLSDPTYLLHRIQPSGLDRLPYEQRLLTQWFRQRFEAAASGQASP
jgi:hypothetical protein